MAQTQINLTIPMPDWADLRDQIQWLKDTSENEVCERIIKQLQIIQEAAVGRGPTYEQVYGVPKVREDIEEFAHAFRSSFGFGTLDGINAVISQYERGMGTSDSDSAVVVAAWELVGTLKGD